MLQEHHYSEKYQYCADYDMLLRMYLAGYKFHYIDYMICDYDLEGLTATKAIANAYREIYQIRKAQGVLTASNVEKARYWIGLAKRYMILYMPNKLRWGCTKFKRRLDGILSKKVA